MTATKQFEAQSPKRLPGMPLRMVKSTEHDFLNTEVFREF